MPSRASTLYDEDFYAWTQQQAAALRSHFRGDNRLDVEHLAEEVEDLGKSQLHAVESFVEQIIAHLLKLDYSAQEGPRHHWRSEVLNFRRSVDRKTSPAIRRAVEADIEGRFRNARELAAVSAAAHEPDMIQRLPRSCPYTWDVVWRRDVMAEAGLDLGGEPANPSRKRGT